MCRIAASKGAEGDCSVAHGDRRFDLRNLSEKSSGDTVRLKAFGWRSSPESFANSSGALERNLCQNSTTTSTFKTQPFRLNVQEPRFSAESIVNAKRV